MPKLEKAITTLHQLQTGAPAKGSLHPLCLPAVTLLYLIAMLSVPIDSLVMLLWFALYPIVMAPVIGEDFTRVFARSLIALPFAALIGIFNPLYHTEPAFTAGGIAVSVGWVEFVSICLRALLSVQALLILIGSGGFIGLCRSLEQAGVPALITTQLLMVYRYMTVLLEESLQMTRARRARGYGRRHMSLKMWGTFCGQLFLRTVSRAEAIHRAMLARGFAGRMPHISVQRRRWTLRDTIMLAACTAAFAVMRFANISAIFIAPGNS